MCVCVTLSHCVQARQQQSNAHCTATILHCGSALGMGQSESALVSAPTSWESDPTSSRAQACGAVRTRMGSAVDRALVCVCVCCGEFHGTHTTLAILSTTPHTHTDTHTCTHSVATTTMRTIALWAEPNNIRMPRGAVCVCVCASEMQEAMPASVSQSLSLRVRVSAWHTRILHIVTHTHTQDEVLRWGGKCSACYRYPSAKLPRPPPFPPPPTALLLLHLDGFLARNFTLRIWSAIWNSLHVLEF